MTILSRILDVGNWDEEIKNVGNFLEDNPLAAAIAVGAVGWFAAPAIASYFAVAPVAGAATMTAGQLATAQAAAVSSAATKKFLWGTAASVAGSFLSSKGAANDARRLAQDQQNFTSEQRQRQREDAKVSFVPQNKGVLSSQRGLPVVNNAQPIRKPVMSSTPEQMLAMRKSGVI